MALSIWVPLALLAPARRQGPQDKAPVPLLSLPEWDAVSALKRTALKRLTGSTFHLVVQQARPRCMETCGCQTSWPIGHRMEHSTKWHSFVLIGLGLLKEAGLHDAVGFPLPKLFP